MSYTPPTGRDRCEVCGWHRPTQGHAPECSRSRCIRCKLRPKIAGSRWCAWCTATKDRPTVAQGGRKRRSRSTDTKRRPNALSADLSALRADAIQARLDQLAADTTDVKEGTRDDTD